MARADLLIGLVKASATGDAAGAKVAAEAIIAEERAKKHNILAERLTRAMQTTWKSNGQPGAGLLRVQGASRNDFLVEISPSIRIEDLVLSDTTRLACTELIEEQYRASILRAHSLEPRHRVLLSGPPGNGKTSLAEAIAESLAVPFLVVRYEAIIGSYLGETASRMRRVFDYARTTPCVLFFDEFDAVGKERGDQHETGEIKRVVTSLLMQVDELPSYTVVVAATNHAELLDRAVWRRFQLRLSLAAPTRKELAQYFEAFARTLDEPLGRSPEMIAKSLGPISYAEAEEFCRDVRRRSVLAMGEMPLSKIATERLKLWSARVNPTPNKDFNDGRLPSSTSAQANP